MNKKSSIDMLRERIKTLKNENRETQKAFAERCDIDPNKLSNLMTRGKAIQYDEVTTTSSTGGLQWALIRADYCLRQKAGCCKRVTGPLQSGTILFFP